MKKICFNKKIKLSRDMKIFLIGAAIISAAIISKIYPVDAMVVEAICLLFGGVITIIFTFGIPLLIVVAIRYFVKNTKEGDK